MGQDVSCISSTQKQRDLFLVAALKKLNSQFQINTPQNITDDVKVQKKYANMFVYIPESQNNQKQGFLYKEGCMLYYGPIVQKKANGSKGYCIWKYKEGQFNASTSTYQGQFKDNQAHGKGNMTNNQMQFQGEWFEGMPYNGKLKLLLLKLQLRIVKLQMNKNFDYSKGYIQVKKQNQWKYEGEIKKNDNHYKFDGEGKIVYNQGGSYMGTWKDGKYHGKGRYIWQGAQRQYEGSYENGQKHGMGVQSFGDSLIFEGQWVHNKKNGIFKIIKYQGLNKIQTRIKYNNGKPQSDFA